MLPKTKLANVARITHSEITIVNLPQMIQKLKVSLNDKQQFCNFKSKQDVESDITHLSTAKMDYAAFIRQKGSYFVIPFINGSNNIQQMTQILRGLKNPKEYRVHFALMNPENLK